MNVPFNRFSAVMLATLFLSANAAVAQSIRIQNGEGNWGFGWMFQHGGNCYAVLPRHVAGELFPKVTVSTAAPVVSDQAVVLKPFWEGVDLALAVIDRGVLDERCLAQLSDLNVTTSGRSTMTALLTRITSSGQEERLPIEVRDRTYLTFEGAVTRDGDKIGEGTSGAFAFVAGRPIGMAYDTTDTDFARFMRAEEISLNVERFLADQGTAFAPSVQPAPDTDYQTSTGAFQLQEASANTPPILPHYGPENLQGDGIYVVAPNGPVELTYRLAGELVQGVQRVILTAPETEEFAVPKTVAIYLDGGEAGTRFRFWTQGEMRPDGVFDTGPMAARNAKWIRIVISGAWSDRPIALDELTVE